MPVTYFGNDKSTSYLYKGKYDHSFADKLHILLPDVDTTKVCTRSPNSVQENGFFVIDRARLKNAADWLMTDVGAFDHRGVSSRIFKTDSNQILESAMFRGKKSEMPQLREVEYFIRNVFYRRKKYQDFLRTVTTLVDCHGDELQLGLVEYRTGKSFIQTAPSTRGELKCRVKGHQGPSSIFDELIGESGGIFGCKVITDMPRDVKQVTNALRCSTKKKARMSLQDFLPLQKTHHPSRTYNGHQARELFSVQMSNCMR